MRPSDQKNKKAIVTLAIGTEYLDMFERFCRTNWTKYALKHGYDIIVHTEPLDNSDRARSRNPAWQKCLILSDDRIKNYDQVVWIDADILINPNSPDITDNVPINKIGAVDAYSTPSKLEYYESLKSLYDYYRAQNMEFVDSSTPTAYHAAFGLEGDFDVVVQTGVLVCSPSHHRDLFELVYSKYDDKGGAPWNYEMRPLSFEILTRGLEFWLSPKFNMPWIYIRQFYYPFLNNPNLLERKMERYHPRISLKAKCVTVAYLNNYFLHFAGGTAVFMKFVDFSRESIFTT